MNNWMNLKSGVCTLLRDHYHFVTARGSHKSHVSLHQLILHFGWSMIYMLQTLLLLCAKCNLSHAAITFYTVDFVASGITVQVFTQHCPKKARPVWKEVRERELRLSRRRAVCTGAHSVLGIWAICVGWAWLDALGTRTRWSVMQIASSCGVR